MGAGAVGCYLGGRLAEGGAEVTLVGRPRLEEELRSHGLTLTSLDGASTTLPWGRFGFSTGPASLADRDVILCCVKSAQTAEAGAALASVLARGAVVVSFQNGLSNPEALRAALPGQLVLAGIVGFNVLSRGGGAFRQATSGLLMMDRSRLEKPAALAEALTRARFDLQQHADLRPHQWAKLLMNLNNAVSALSDAPTREILLSAGYRRVLAALIEEGLTVLRAAGIRPARLGAIPVGLFPHVLRLPSGLVQLVARAQLKIDPEARSSMWEDLARGRLTEVDYLNGEIVRLAESCGAKAPLNRRVVELVHQVEREGKGSPRLGAEALLAALG